MEGGCHAGEGQAERGGEVTEEGMKHLQRDEEQKEEEEGGEAGGGGGHALGAEGGGGVMPPRCAPH